METTQNPTVREIDHVECKSCGAEYDAYRRFGCAAVVICGACGCRDERLVRITTTTEAR